MTSLEVKKSVIAINWIESNLFIPDGRMAGKPFKLAGFQKEFIRKVYDNPAGTRTSILSLPRKNAKTAITAVLMLLHLCGPFAHMNSQLYSIANTRDQAAILYKYAVQVAMMSPNIRPFLKVTASKKMLSCHQLGTVFQALSADATGSKSQGYSPIWFCADEIGQTVGPRNPLFDAMRTGQAAHENPMMFLISTQAAQDGDLLSQLIDDAQADSDPKTVCVLYHAPVDMDIFSEEALKVANPAWDEFINKEELKNFQAQAKRMPSFENEFRNKYLNMRIEKNEAFIAKPIWDENKTKPEDYFGKKVFLGIDLSESRDLTSCAVIHLNEDGHSFSVNMRYWLPEHGIADKARQDRIDYPTWERNGLLCLTPGKSVDYDFVAAEIARLHEDCDIQAVAFDRWNLKHFRKSLVDQGISENWIDKTFVEFGQGFKSMSPAIRELESLLLKGDFHHGANPILTWNFRNIKVIRDPAGNRKFDKLGKTRRIDGAVASVMAVSAAQERLGKPSFKSYLEEDDMIFL